MVQFPRHTTASFVVRLPTVSEEPRMGTPTTMARRTALSATVIALLASTVRSLGAACTDHPAYFSGLVPVLMKSWSYEMQEPNTTHHSTSMYLPRYAEHAYAPSDDEADTRFFGMDYFFSYTDAAAPTDKYIRMEFQRSAMVYLLVVVDYDETFPASTLTGWESEGWLSLVKGDQEAGVQYGVHENVSMWISSRVYAFSMSVDDFVDLPDTKWVLENFAGASTEGYYNILIAEADGSPSKAPAAPEGFDDILPLTTCPSELHDTWVVKDDDPDDPDTAGKTWATWVCGTTFQHPQWDPCYWCAYEHDHGSSAKDLMGYTPKYSYVSWKNGREDEEHAGFKGFVLESGPYRIYYNLHVHTSAARRVATQFHTITLVVVDAATNEKLVELNHKGDFGFLATRRAKPEGGFMPFTPDAIEMEAPEKEMYWKPHKLRSVNVIDPDNLDSRFLFRDGDGLLRGEYEAWITQPICVYNKRWAETVVDVKDPQTALKSPDSLTDFIPLGGERDGKFMQAVGLRREFLTEDMTISDDLCVFKLLDIEGKSTNGTFYTDPYGQKLLSGPGEAAVRQFIKPGFTYTFSGTFEPVEFWTGLYQDGVIGTFENIGYGIDPTLN